MTRLTSFPVELIGALVILTGSGSAAALLWLVFLVGSCCCGAASTCCPNPLPGTLYATVTASTCPCLPVGTRVTLTGGPTQYTIAASFYPCGLTTACYQVHIVIYCRTCPNVPMPRCTDLTTCVTRGCCGWHIEVSCANDFCFENYIANADPRSTCSCDPLSIIFDTHMEEDLGSGSTHCCNNAGDDGDVTWEITV